MELEIEKLLANLDSEGILNILPCFFDRPDKIQFRIGFNDGPRIEFSPLNQEYYSLVIADESGRHYSYSIINGIKQFEICQSIYNKIRALCLDKGYVAYRDGNIGIMIANLKNIIEPILGKIQNNE